MIAESVSSKQRWTEADKTRLRDIHEKTGPESRSSKFFEKVTESFGNRSYASVVEECRRLGLKAKRNPRTDLCEHCETDLRVPEADRIGNACRKCYNKNWYKARLQ